MTILRALEQPQAVAQQHGRCVSLCAPIVYRYFGKEAAQIIIKLAAGNGFKKIFVGQDALMATPAMSAFIRRRHVYGEWWWHGSKLAAAASASVDKKAASLGCGSKWQVAAPLRLPARLLVQLAVSIAAAPTEHVELCWRLHTKVVFNDSCLMFACGVH